MRIALAQINPTVGDLEGNAAKILDFARRAKKQKADIVVFPELAITGYPPEDLLLKPSFLEDNLRALQKIARKIDRITTIVGFVDRRRKDIYNAAAVISGGKIKAIAHKILLPNYGVFDEKRYFKAGITPFVFGYRRGSRGQTSVSLQRSGLWKLGVNICEDVWHDEGPTRVQAKQGARIIFTINASPYHAGKIQEREAVVRRQARKNKVWICYVNMVGGQDELVFDGHSVVVDTNGAVVARAAPFQEELLVVDIDVANSKCKIQNAKSQFKIQNVEQLSLEEEIYRALASGLRDYVRKNGFKKVVIGLSGGIDSSLVAVLAVDALGKENVVGVAMPSRFSSKESLEDAKRLSKNLGSTLLTIPIENQFSSFLQTLKPQFRRKRPDVTEENLQARIRGNILMALSNKFGWLVLSTGNKSETSVGYVTLYGDTAGGFAPIKDVYKTMVYKLVRWRNSLRPALYRDIMFLPIGKNVISGQDVFQPIPQRVLEKAPSAELRPGQKDTDSLPPYEILDPILKAYIEEDKGISEIVRLGFPRSIVQRVIAMVDRNEYKRRQAPPGIKITPKAFGKDRRMPITNRYIF